VRTLTYTLTPLVRAALILGGALLVSNLVPAVLAFWDIIARIVQPSAYLTPYAASDAPPPAFALLLPGGVGIIMLRTALQEGRAKVRADAQGISRSLGRQTTILRWDGVERVEGRARKGRIISYLLIGELGATQVEWRTRSTWYLRLTPPVGTTAITPDEMAALAVRESGHPLRIESVT
jgi:hypothetical protein